MTSYRGLLVTLLGAATLIFLPSTAHASPPTETRTIEVRAEYTEPMPQFDGVQCLGLEKNQPWCQAAFPGPVTFTGTIAGEARAENFGPTADGHQYEGADIFEHAVVEGCGEGGLILDVTEGDFDFANTDLGDRSTPSHNKWRVRPGSGTGGLVGMSGEGENNWRPYWTETGERWGRGVFTGTITCQVPRTPAPPKRTDLRTIQVRAEYSEPITQFFGAECRGLATGEPGCVGRFGGPATFTGTIQGVTYYDGKGPASDGHMYEGPDIFEDAVVEGCGRGGFILDTFEGDMATDAHPEDGSTGGTNRWRLRPGSGTGGLVGLVSGEGENHWHQYWGETGTEAWGRGLFTGTITCEVPVGEARNEPRVAAAAASEPAVAVLGARSQPVSELPRTGGALATALAGAALLAAGLLGRRMAS